MRKARIACSKKASAWRSLKGVAPHSERDGPQEFEFTFGGCDPQGSKPDRLGLDGHFLRQQRVESGGCDRRISGHTGESPIVAKVTS